MRFECKCGYIIHDTTDYISYKGRVIADQDWFDFYDRIEEAIKSNQKDKEQVINEFWRDTSGIANEIYQCPKCGCIFISGKGRELHSFEPNSQVTLNLLISAKGEKWQGFLYAEWDDVKPEWRENHGLIYALVNAEYSGSGYDDYEEFEKRYYELFEELKAKGIIRSASLKRNGKELHSWDAEEIDLRWNF